MFIFHAKLCWNSLIWKTSETQAFTSKLLVWMKGFQILIIFSISYRNICSGSSHRNAFSKNPKHMSHDMRFTTMWYVRQAKAQTSLRIRAVWSAPLLVAWIFYDCSAACRTALGVSELNRRLCMLVWLCSCENTTLLEITYHGPYALIGNYPNG